MAILLNLVKLRCRCKATIEFCMFQHGCGEGERQIKAAVASFTTLVSFNVYAYACMT